MSNYSSVKSAIQKLTNSVSQSEMYEVSETGARKKGQIGSNIKDFGPLLAKAARSAAIEIGTRILQDAMQEVPIDTGELAESGTLQMGSKVYARGTVNGIERDLEGNAVGADTGITILDKASGNRPDAEDYTNYSKGSANIFVTFYKGGTQIPNLAMWLHENMEIGGAKLPGRGGKFIERPFMRHYPDFNKVVKQKVQEIVSKGKK